MAFPFEICLAEGSYTVSLQPPVTQKHREGTTSALSCLPPGVTKCSDYDEYYTTDGGDDADNSNDEDNYSDESSGSDSSGSFDSGNSLDPNGSDESSEGDSDDDIDHPSDYGVPDLIDTDPEYPEIEVYRGDLAPDNESNALAADEYRSGLGFWSDTSDYGDGVGSDEVVRVEVGEPVPADIRSHYNPSPADELESPDCDDENLHEVPEDGEMPPCVRGYIYPSSDQEEDWPSGSEPESPYGYEQFHAPEPEVYTDRSGVADEAQHDQNNHSPRRRPPHLPQDMCTYASKLSYISNLAANTQMRTRGLIAHASLASTRSQPSLSFPAGISSFPCCDILGITGRGDPTPSTARCPMCRDLILDTLRIYRA